MTAPARAPYTVPGPYKAEGRTVKALDHGRWHTIATCDSRGFLSDYAERDMAAHFVEVCNAHDDLVAALEWANNALDCVCTSEAACPSCIVEAALTKARGE